MAKTAQKSGKIIKSMKNDTKFGAARWITVSGAKEHNLKNIDVAIPKCSSWHRRIRTIEDREQLVIKTELHIFINPVARLKVGIILSQVGIAAVLQNVIFIVDFQVPAAATVVYYSQHVDGH